MQIAIAAHSGDVDLRVKSMVKDFLKELYSRCPSSTLLLGGYWGLMKLVVDEALRLGFKVVVVLPLERHDVELPSGVVRIDSGCEFRCRSVILVRSGDVLVSLGGGVGTMIEMMLAYAMGKPVYALVGTSLSSDNFPKAFPEYIDDRKVVRIKYFTDPIRLAEEVCRERPASIRTMFG